MSIFITPWDIGLFVSTTETVLTQLLRYYFPKHLYCEIKLGSLQKAPLCSDSIILIVHQQQSFAELSIVEEQKTLSKFMAFPSSSRTSIPPRSSSKALKSIVETYQETVPLR